VVTDMLGALSQVLTSKLTEIDTLGG
jgi:hypothetical protein